MKKQKEKNPYAGLKEHEKAVNAFVNGDFQWLPKKYCVKTHSSGIKFLLYRKEQGSDKKPITLLRVPANNIEHINNELELCKNRCSLPLWGVTHCCLSNDANPKSNVYYEELIYNAQSLEDTLDLETTFRKYMRYYTSSENNPESAVELSGKIFYMDIVAVKLANGGVLGNSSSLRARTSKFDTYYNGFAKLNINWFKQAPIQAYMEIRFKMFPFSVLGNDLFTYKSLDIAVLDSGPNMYFRLAQDHFIGAGLFKITAKTSEGTTTTKVYLLDTDRNEEHLHPFFTDIPDMSVTTIAQAYEALKPELVKRAEKLGKTVLRQGEWFFIPVPGAKDPKQITSIEQIYWKKQLSYGNLQIFQSAVSNLEFSEEDKHKAFLSCPTWFVYHHKTWQNAVKYFLDKRVFLDETGKLISTFGSLRVEEKDQCTTVYLPNSSSHTVERLYQRKSIKDPITDRSIKEFPALVKGLVTHRTNQDTKHAPIFLDGWHLALKNTSPESFNLSGYID